MKTYLFLASLFLLLIGCNNPASSPCESVTCFNGGFCNDEGKCNCPGITKGENCETMMSAFIIDSIIIQHNSDFDKFGNLIETTAEGNPDFYLELLSRSNFGGTFVAIQTTGVQNEIVKNTSTTFITNWQFAIDAKNQEYQLRLWDEDPNSTRQLFRDPTFLLNIDYNIASQQISSADGQFVATFYYTHN